MLMDNIVWFKGILQIGDILLELIVSGASLTHNFFLFSLQKVLRLNPIPALKLKISRD